MVPGPTGKYGVDVAPTVTVAPRLEFVIVPTLRLVMEDLPVQAWILIINRATRRHASHVSEIGAFFQPFYLNFNQF